MNFELKQSVVLLTLVCTFALSVQSVAQAELENEDDFNNSFLRNDWWRKGE